MDVLQTGVGPSLTRIGDELGAVIDQLASGENTSTPLERVADLIEGSSRVFVLGAGRSGLALQMTAMRLMHLGLEVHVVGEVTAPAIGANDLLLTASGSGATGGIVRAANVAVVAGAQVAVITTADDSPLAQYASAVIVVPAAAKLDRTGSASAQYAGSLFEQAVVVLGDALFDSLWKRSGQSADELWPRHANIE
ncbi:6-phospho-3-hexuloisomerase [Subtercola frigoramans]|uniref:6-phospho-3-hexuloisomerase n=1 Tax=Subtercola frigoramans TaxID=120298 RepID=A0ABS2L1S9_9MICO|nr:6-phospho-3-hexuloisomerase [Subtercola frigoramans]MBM7470720.1 6-phospho-3-hexuloisomerase [Subtercola frigoramans]